MITLVYFADEFFTLLFFEVEHVHLAVGLMLYEVQPNNFIYQIDSQSSILFEGIEEKEGKERSP